MKIPYIGIILTFYLVTEISEGAGRYNCKTPKLENGSARIRSRGRLVRYRCKKRYKLFGSKVAVCRNEEWTFPTPVCVANGRKCPKLKKTKDMIIESKLRSGLLKYSCKSGLTLIGNSTLYCNGSEWSSEVPQCIYVEPKKSCDFETADLCDWEQDGSDTPYFDWTRTTAAQIKHSTGTGPSSDHTYPDKDTGHYLFMEASRPRMRGDYTTLLSPHFNPVETGLCFEFWYHMLGRDGEGDVGSLKVGIKDADASSSNLDPVWSISGNQGDIWHKGSLEIGARTSRFQILITGTRGDDHRGDIAIDDVSITNCTQDSTTTELTATSTSYIETTLASENVTKNKDHQPMSVTQETTSAETIDKTQDAKTVEVTSQETIRHTTQSHVTSNVTSITKERDINTITGSELTSLTPDITVIPADRTSISVTAETKTINMKTTEPGIKPTTNVEKTTAKSLVTTEYKTKPADKESKAQQTTLTTTGYQTKVQTTNGSRNPTTNPVSTSTFSSTKKPTKIRTSTIKSTAAVTSLESFTENPTKISTKKSSTTSVTSASRLTTKSAKTTSSTLSTKMLTSTSQSSSKLVKIQTTTPRTTKQLTTTSTLTSQSRTTTKPTERTKTTEKIRTTTTTLPPRSTTKPTEILTTLPASTKKLTTTAATSPSSSTKKSVSTTAFRSTRLTTTPMIMTRPTYPLTSTGKTESSTRKTTTKTSFKTTKAPSKTMSTSTLSTTVRPSAPSTKSYQTTLRNFDFYNNTINEDVYVITTHSTNDTDIPNIIVVEDPPVRTLLIGLAAGVAVGLVIVVVGCYLWIRRKRRKDLECDEMMPITGTGSQEW